jgi:hypothetical protein
MPHILPTLHTTKNHKDTNHELRVHGDRAPSSPERWVPRHDRCRVACHRPHGLFCDKFSISFVATDTWATRNLW